MKEHVERSIEAGIRHSTRPPFEQLLPQKFRRLWSNQQFQSPWANHPGAVINLILQLTSGPTTMTKEQSWPGEIATGRPTFRQRGEVSADSNALTHRLRAGQGHVAVQEQAFVFIYRSTFGGQVRLGQANRCLGPEFAKRHIEWAINDEPQ